MPGAIPLNAATAVAGNLLEDQYFASPKRKDCRLMKASENLGLPEDNKGQQHHHKENSKADNSKTIGEGGSGWVPAQF